VQKYTRPGNGIVTVKGTCATWYCKVHARDWDASTVKYTRCDGMAISVTVHTARWMAITVKITHAR